MECAAFDGASEELDVTIFETTSAALSAVEQAAAELVDKVLSCLTRSRFQLAERVGRVFHRPPAVRASALFALFKVVISCVPIYGILKQQAGLIKTKEVGISLILSSGRF